jgi:hypothetical protein
VARRAVEEEQQEAAPTTTAAGYVEKDTAGQTNMFATVTKPVG